MQKRDYWDTFTIIKQALWNCCVLLEGGHYFILVGSIPKLALGYCCSLLAETSHLANCISHLLWNVSEEPARVLYKGIHSPAALNNLTKLSTDDQRDGKGFIFLVTLQSAHISPLKKLLIHLYCYKLFHKAPKLTVFILIHFLMSFLDKTFCGQTVKYPPPHYIRIFLTYFW